MQIKALLSLKVTQRNLLRQKSVQAKTEISPCHVRQSRNSTSDQSRLVLSVEQCTVLFLTHHPVLSDYWELVLPTLPVRHLTATTVKAVRPCLPCLQTSVSHVGQTFPVLCTGIRQSQGSKLLSLVYGHQTIISRFCIVLFCFLRGQSPTLHIQTLGHVTLWASQFHVVIRKWRYRCGVSVCRRCRCRCAAGTVR